MPVALLPLTACGLHQASDGDICTQPRMVAGVAETRGSSTGSFELQTTGGASTVSFSTPPVESAGPTQSFSATMQGEVHDDGSGGTLLTVNVESSFDPYAEFHLPDLRAYQTGAVVDVPVQGSVQVEGGWCNFSAVASLTITRAVGARSPSPNFVTGDFVRSGSLALDAPATEGVAGAPDGDAPQCAGTVVARATIELTAAGYAPVYDDGSCVDLSK